MRTSVSLYRLYLAQECKPSCSTMHPSLPPVSPTLQGGCCKWGWCRLVIFCLWSQMRTSKFRKSTRQLSPLSELPGVDRNAYSQIIKATFLELAIPFICSQSSEKDLGIRSRQVAARLYGQLKRLNTKLLMVGANDSTEVQVREDERGTESTNTSNATLSMLGGANTPESLVTVLKSEMISRAFWVGSCSRRELGFVFNVLCAKVQAQN